ncbi:MAG: hypothetical protein AABW41_05300 [Nanoarchaeota archaeon]
MNSLKKFALTGLAALVMGFGAAKGLEARTLRVPSHYPTIQAAIDKAKDGDEVLVAQGRYSGGIVIDKQIVLRSEAGYSNTELYATESSTYSVVYIHIPNDESTGRGRKVEYTIDGFTINGSGRNITGINDQSSFDNGSIESNGYILNNLVENCKGYQGIAQVNGVLHVRNNIVRNNWAGIVGFNSLVFADHNLIYGQGGAGIIKPMPNGL